MHAPPPTAAHSAVTGAELAVQMAQSKDSRDPLLVGRHQRHAGLADLLGLIWEATSQPGRVGDEVKVCWARLLLEVAVESGGWMGQA